ncbi:MAG TPA: HD domain-containing protein [Defluviitoga sp.]|nr:HD domain-containing protein [Defluviitoga sp.]HOP23804.1 HD domain-containing protein [Defluviitoga sp.]HPZ28449.1 HD domain-containing protein [Defluviitoga sp.]HQD62817.1 HD domain-containing protein [Defluviitoga sp.]
MKSVPFYELKPGQVVAEDVFKGSTLLIAKGTVLKARDIERLKNHGIKSVTVYDENDFIAGRIEERITVQFEDIPPLVEEEKYTQWQEQFEFVKDITYLKEDTSELEALVEDIYKKFLKADDLVLNLFHSIGEKALNAHSINTAIISTLVASKLDMPELFLNYLLKTCLLHDIGYSLIGSRVIFDYEDLDDVTVRSHILSAYEMLRGIQKEIGKDVVDSVSTHHERFDGNGIFMRLKENSISPLVRILQVGDAYDSCIEVGHSPYEAMSFLLRYSGLIFDPYYVSVFFSIAGLYPTGTEVILNNGKRAIVIRKGKTSSFPVVKFDDIIIETGVESGLFIKEVVRKGE